MAHFKKFRQRENVGKITYGDAIIEEIIILVISELENIDLYGRTPYKKMRSSSVRVNVEKDGVHVDVDVKIHYSQSVSDLAFRIQEAVKHNVESMTEYRIVNVNVNVLGVMFNDEEKLVQTENQ